MIDIVKQTIRLFLTSGKSPEINKLKIEDLSLLEKKGALFVTLYKDGEVRGSAGNIKPIEDNLLKELIESTVSSIVNDERFEKLTIADVDDLKVRIDLVTSEIILVKEKELTNLEPKKLGVIAIKKDYSKMAVILPNISSTLHFGKDYPELLGNKLGETFDFKNYIVYKMETSEITDF